MFVTSGGVIKDESNLLSLIGKGRRYGAAGRGMRASGKKTAGSTDEKAEPVAISVVNSRSYQTEEEHVCAGDVIEAGFVVVKVRG